MSSKRNLTASLRSGEDGEIELETRFICCSFVVQKTWRERVADAKAKKQREKSAEIYSSSGKRKRDDDGDVESQPASKKSKPGADDGEPESSASGNSQPETPPDIEMSFEDMENVFKEKTVQSNVLTFLSHLQDVCSLFFPLTYKRELTYCS